MLPIVSRGYSITNQKASQQFGYRFYQPNGEANKNKNDFIMKFLDLIVFSALASVICQEKNIISFISTDFVLR